MFPCNLKHFIFVGFLVIISLAGCKKRDTIDTNPSLKLDFSTDTVFFDTVFTTIGSVTQRLVVHNKNEKMLSISSVWLAGGSSSLYSININGSPGIQAENVEIPGHDSIFIFVRVTVDPNSDKTPFVVADSIMFLTNGNQQNVKLVAWGQNARFLKDHLVVGNQTWDSLLPWVIYGHVRIDTGAVLSLDPGTRVYFHFGSFMAVSKDASLKINGTSEHPVIFTGDRLDDYYKDLPGQWEGIYLERGSSGHEINYAVIQNGRFGLSVDSMPAGPGPMLTLNNTIIQNTSSDGIYAYSTHIVSVNCVLGNNGGNSLDVEKGGSYEFRQMTLANYWSTSVRNVPALYLSNYTYDGNLNKITNPLEQAFFGNSLVYGANEDEIATDFELTAAANYRFDHCIVKTDPDKVAANPANYLECLVNEDPLFVDPSTLDFRIDSLSPAIDKGIPMGVPLDINGVDRGSTPDLGAYEWVPVQPRK